MMGKVTVEEDSRQLRARDLESRIASWLLKHRYGFGEYRGGKGYEVRLDDLPIGNGRLAVFSESTQFPMTLWERIWHLLNCSRWRTSRRVMLGVLKFRYRPARQWVFDVHGEPNLRIVEDLARDLANEFKVGIRVRLDSREFVFEGFRYEAPDETLVYLER